MKKKHLVIILIFILAVFNACKDTSEEELNDLITFIAAYNAGNFASSGCGQDLELVTGDQTILSSNTSREYYLKLPAEYDNRNVYPIIFAFHGLGGNYNHYVGDESYNLESSVGEEAILVYPNALEYDGATKWDVIQWDDNNIDLAFFDDLYTFLEASLCIDKRKVFAVGHSNGAVFSNMLGWNKGHILRAIGPVAGFLTGVAGNLGQVAAIQVHGTNDEYFSTDMARTSLDFWIDVNNCSSEITVAGIDSDYCVAYSNCDTNFPIQYCEHDLVDGSGSGHAWPDFAGNAIWNFFKSLPAVLPSEMAGTIDSTLGVITFQVNYPGDFTGTPYKLALGLYPPETDPLEPLTGIPSGFLSLDFSPGDYVFGGTVDYNNISINLTGIDPGDYLLVLLVYVEGSTYPIPVGETDYVGFQSITISEDTIAITLDTPYEIDFMLLY